MTATAGTATTVTDIVNATVIVTVNATSPAAMANATETETHVNTATVSATVAEVVEVAVEREVQQDVKIMRNTPGGTAMRTADVTAAETKSSATADRRATKTVVSGEGGADIGKWVRQRGGPRRRRTQCRCRRGNGKQVAGTFMLLVTSNTLRCRPNRPVSTMMILLPHSVRLPCQAHACLRHSFCSLVQSSAWSAAVSHAKHGSCLCVAICPQMDMVVWI